MTSFLANVFGNETFIIGVSFLIGGISFLLILNEFFFSKKTTTHKPWPMVPGRRPILGHLHHVFGNIGNFTFILEEWADKYGAENGAFEFEMLGKTFVVACREDRILEIMKHRPYKVTRGKSLVAAFDSIGAKGIFSAEGHNWGIQRRLVAPSLNQSNVQDYLESMKLVSGRLFDKWTSIASKGESVVINQDLYNLSMDAISMTTFGKDFDFLSQHQKQQGNSVNDKNSGVLKGQDMEGALTGVVKRIFPPPLFKIPIIGQYLDGVGFYRDRVLKFFNSLLDEYKDGQVALDNTKKKNFLGKIYTMMNKSEEKSKLSREVTAGNLLTLFIGGTDTTAAALMFAFWKLAMVETELQDELAKEAHGIDIPNVTLQELMEKLPRLRSFLQEIHRCYGGVANLDFHVEEEIEFCGTTIPKDTPVFTLFRYASTNKISPSKHVPLGPNGEQPCDFCPQRWLNKAASKAGGDEVISFQPADIKGAGFLLFGHGARICPGRVYSEALSYIALASFLQQYRISLEPNHPPVRSVLKFAIEPNTDVKIVLKKRQV